MSPSKATQPIIWVSPREACRISSIGMTVLYRFLNDGTIVSRKVGRKRLVSVESLERLGEVNGTDGFSPPSLGGHPSPNPNAGRGRGRAPDTRRSHNRKSARPTVESPPAHR
jgi:hypothetical protein